MRTTRKTTVLELVDDFAEGLANDPAYDLSDELPPDFNRRSLRALTTLADVAQAKLGREGWTTDGPWQLWWSYCGSDVTDSLNETDDTDSSGADSERNRTMAATTYPSRTTTTTLSRSSGCAGENSM